MALQHLDALGRVSGASESTLERLAQGFPTGRGLATASEPQLRRLGCSEAQARRIVAAFDLARAARDSNRPDPVDRPSRAWEFILDRRPDLPDLEVEVFVVVALNARQRPLEMFIVGQGGLAQVDVHPREVFAPLVRMRAHSCIVAHNHPSGDASPSRADIDLTRRLEEAGRLIGIPVLDHLVITRDDCTSLASMGLVGGAPN